MITKERENKKKENKGKRADDTLFIVLCRENGFGVSASCLPLERLQLRIQNNGASVSESPALLKNNMESYHLLFSGS
jgi:hypothetical protein